MGQKLKSAKVMFRRLLKNCISFFVLAPWYHLCCLRPVQKGLVVLADGHQNHMPYSMQALRERLAELPDITVKEYFHDYSFSTPFAGMKTMLHFMPLYARAEYLFICDSFVPSACCKKRSGTTLIQLWHSCGLMKKVGADSPEDSSAMMRGQYRNTDVFTTSAAVVSDVLSATLDIPRENFSAAGVSRMDLLYRTERVDSLRSTFNEWYPQYRDKKIVLWAPTFRGNVRSAYLVGEEDVLRLRHELAEDHAVIIKTHRFANSEEINTPVKFTAEQLVAIADALITDYSSIYFDYLYFRKPIILFAPDLEQYQRERGIYPDYLEMPGRVVRDYDQLRDAVVHMDDWADDAYRAQLDRLWNEQMDYCDGRSTDKLLEQLGLLQPAEVER